MAKQTVPKIKVPQHHSPRNAFDLSSRHNFSSPVGALLPIWCLDLMPHDHVDLTVTDFMRAMPMNSSAFIDAKGTYEFFFVPYAQLWHPFDQFITSMNDYKSVVIADKFTSNGSFGRSFPNVLPTISLAQLVALLQPNSDETSATGQLLNSATDEFGYSVANGAARLADFLGYGFWRSSGSTPEAVSSVNAVSTNGSATMNIFRFLAYQKIYQDIYRNTSYEQQDVYSFNIDNLTGPLGSSDIRLSWFKMHYRNYGLDLLTNIRPNALLQPIFGDSSGAINKASANSFYPRGFAGDVNGGYYISGQPYSGNFVDLIVPSTGSATTPTYSVSLSSLRAAFAYEKLLDFMGRAPKTYADQMKAIYGVNVSNGRDGKVRYVGGFDSPFNIGDINQTSPTQDGINATAYQNYLGSSTGKMTGGNSGHVEFDANEFGVLMCIYSVIPTSMYDSTRIDPFVYKSKRTDYYIPMYDHLGMQPLFADAISYYGFTHAHEMALGWQPRYSEYKTAVDINHGQFNSGQPLDYWTSSRQRKLTAWLQSQDSATGITYAALKVNPNMFDNVFSVEYNGSPASDPFFGSAYFNCVKVSDMDTDAMPKL